jgi:hypothetical protein
MGLLPTIALGIGVVVAGLGIGAFISAFQNKSADTTTTVRTGVPQVTPVAQRTRGPVAVATAVPHPTESPSPTPSPLPTASPRASATPRATATPQGTATPRATPTAAPTATAAATATARPTETPAARPTATPVVVTPRPATPRPTVVPTARPTPRATAAPPTPLTFAGAAQNTVRRYLSDLIAGNENAAYAELGKSPGEGGLTEEAFIDRNTRIVSVRTTHSDANSVTVEVELASGRGNYYATYHVVNGPGGPIIDQHDYIKV